MKMEKEKSSWTATLFRYAEGAEGKACDIGDTLSHKRNIGTCAFLLYVQDNMPVH